MYIEDLLQRVTNHGQWAIGSGRVFIDWTQQDSTFLDSVSEQLFFNNSTLTEKQGALILRIFDKNRDKIRSWVKDIDVILQNPKWKNPFRVLPKVKTIAIGTHNQPAKFVNGKCIIVEFPYDQALIEVFKKRNNDLHELHKGHWDAGLKKWIFGFTERNIAWLGDNLLLKEFHADQEFLETYNNIKEVRDSVEDHLPMLTLQNGRYTIVNAHQSVLQPNTDNLAKALFFAKEYGINTWDDAVEADIVAGQVDSSTKLIVSHNSKTDMLWFDSKAIAIDRFKELVTYGGPLLVIVPGGSELETLQQWVHFVLTNGIDAEQISVMFRLPNEQADFNKFVKEAALNSPINERTHMVFVSTKITKPLVKSNLRFNTVVNLGYYNYMHFTMSTIVDNATNLVYYSMKAPTKRTQWRQQELS